MSDDFNHSSSEEESLAQTFDPTNQNITENTENFSAKNVSTALADSDGPEDAKDIVNKEKTEVIPLELAARP
jgi:hypothetical protein